MKAMAEEQKLGFLFGTLHGGQSVGIRPFVRCYQS